MTEYKITSYTRLQAYKTCSEFYKLKYKDKLKVGNTPSLSDSKGIFIHSVLEEFLDPSTKTNSIDDAMYIYFSTWLKDLEVEIDLQEVWEFANEFGYLMWRATSMCLDPELKIRTKDNKVPNDLQSWPPSSWKSALSKSGLSKAKLSMDNLAGASNELFIKSSFSYFVGGVFACLKGFMVPDWVGTTLFVERGFSISELDKLKFPSASNLYFRGQIDWVVRDKEDKLVLLDHKTNNKKPTQQSVRNNPQLNLYAWGYRLVYGEWPDKIGIHHVPTGEFVLVSVNKETVKRTLAHYVNIQKEGIEKQSFIKKHPEDYSSPCIKKDWSTGIVKEQCPFLFTCWPEYSDSLNVDYFSSHDSIFL